jgi:hypothetical protein
MTAGEQPEHVGAKPTDRERAGTRGTEDGSRLTDSPTIPLDVPGSRHRGGNGNLNRTGARERAGTSGTCLFEPLSSFVGRAAKLAPPAWLLDGLVPDSGRLLIVGAPNVGKTWLALFIAKLAAEAEREVLVVLEEGHPRSVLSRFEALMVPADAAIHVAHLQGVQLADAAHRGELVMRMKA